MTRADLKPEFSEHHPGSLVSARGRNWVVLSPEVPEVIRLRSLDGYSGDEIGILPEFEPGAVTGATFPTPNPNQTVDSAGLRLLFDAARLQLRSGAGPFRCMGRISVTPRPYQLVPMLMALRLDPVRLLIADDVGVGKTIEAGLIARELLDRGQISRIGVLCPPHLLGQWESELSEKFGLDATVISSSQMARLERALPRPDVSVFAYHRHLIASIDLVKSDRYRGFFLQYAPDLIIVDEAHTAASAGAGQGAPQQQRHRLIRDLAADKSCHLVLATATPHSGIEASFRSLLGLLDPAFDRPDEESLPRRRVARHFVQRKRPDVERWLGTDTPFPERESSELPYLMTPEYVRLYERVRNYLQEFVAVAEESQRHHRRVRYWAATAILRCLLSSPAAAEATLAARRKRRAEWLSDHDPEDIAGDRPEFESSLLDNAEEEEASDYIPTAALNDPDLGLSDEETARLDQFLVQAKRLRGQKHDAKLATCIGAVEELIEDGFSPIVYCRFVQTAEYVAEALAKMLARKLPRLRVRSVTGADGDSEQRKEIVADLTGHHQRVLVATDCLSEGVNLQEHFDAVLHYDLPWNPNRLEQREGRVDRYGQKKPEVRTSLLYGSNNAIDLTVLEVLIRKARAIRQKWGFAVPVPDSDAIVQAVIDSVLERRSDQGRQLALSIEGGISHQFQEQLEAAARRDAVSRSIFAQHAIKPEQVARELNELEPALGNARDLERFFGEALPRFGGSLDRRSDGTCEITFGDLSTDLVTRLDGVPDRPRVRFTGPFPGDPTAVADDEAVAIGRCDPITEFLAEKVLSRCLAQDTGQTMFGRSAVIATKAVTLRCMVTVLRMRYLLTERGNPSTFAEEVLVRAYRGDVGGRLLLLPEQDAFDLLRGIEASENLSLFERAHHLGWALELLDLDPGWQSGIAGERVTELSAAYDRLRGQVGGTRLEIEPHLPPDILGVMVLVPALG